MKITGLIVIANSHIVAYEIDNKDCVWITTLKEKFDTKNFKIENAYLNKKNHIIIKNENELPIKEINDIYENDLLIYSSTNKQPPEYYTQTIYEYDYNDKPIKINAEYFYEFQEYGDKFKPLLYGITTGKPITEMRFLFKNISLASINLSNFDTHLVTDMTGMFNYSATHVLDISSFDTSNVTSMRLMFSQCNIQKLDLTSFNMTSTSDLSRMFANSTIGELILPKMETSRLCKADEIFENAEIEILNLKLIDLSTMQNVKNVIKLLYNCKTYVNTIVYENAHNSIEALLTSDWSQL